MICIEAGSEVPIVDGFEGVGLERTGFREWAGEEGTKGKARRRRWWGWCRRNSSSGRMVVRRRRVEGKEAVGSGSERDNVVAEGRRASDWREFIVLIKQCRRNTTHFCVCNEKKQKAWVLTRFRLKDWQRRKEL